MSKTCSREAAQATEVYDYLRELRTWWEDNRSQRRRIRNGIVAAKHAKAAAAAGHCTEAARLVRRARGAQAGFSRFLNQLYR